MLQKHFPLHFEGILVLAVIGQRLPVLAEVERVWHVRIPRGLRRVDAVLHPALAQAGDRAAVRAVDLEGQQVIAIDAHRPRRVQLRDDVTFQHEGRVSRIFGRRRVASPVFVHPLGDVRRAETHHRADGRKKVIEHVAPVREHVEDDAAAIFFAVVPGGSLCGLPVALEHPVAELAAHGEDTPEEAALDQLLEFNRTGQE